MKRQLQKLFLIAQISVIIFAVLITLFRLGIHSMDGYESNVETWFQEQGVSAKINHLSLRVDNFNPELYLHGLNIFDSSNKPLITLQTATLSLNLWQTMITQHLVIDKAEFYLNKMVVDSALLNTESDGHSDFQIPSELIHSLLGLKHFSLNVKQLDYIDVNKNTHSIFNSKLTLLDKVDKKQVQISSSLFQQKINMLSSYFLIDMEQFLKTSSFSGRGFVGLNIPALADANLPQQLALQGDLKWQNWIEFDGLSGQITSQITTHQLSMMYEQKRHNIEMDSVVYANINADHMMLSMDHNTLNINKVDFSPLTLMVQSALKESGLDNILLQLKHIDINKVAKVLPLIPEFKKHIKLLSQLKPKGEIDEFFVSLPKIGQWEKAKVFMKAQQLQWQAQEGIPSVNAININAVASHEKFNANVSSGSLKVLLNTLYTHPFEVDSLLTNINGQIDEQAVLIELPSIKISRKKATLNGRAKLVFENNASPYLFLRLMGNNADIQMIEPFYPQKLMDKDVLQWVVNSVQQAEIETVDVLYSGRLENDVNFGVNNNGIFVTELKIKGLNLVYDPHWPKVKIKQAQLTFKNYLLNMTSNSAKSLGMMATNVDFNIANLEDAKAKLSLKINEPLEKQWAFLAHSPIKDDIPYFKDVSDLKGRAETAVQASFPLIDLTAKDVLFNVNLKAKKAGFSLNKLGLLLSDLSGAINITQDGLNIKPVKAKWHKQNITLKVDAPTKGMIHINVKGDNMDVKSLSHNLPSEFAQHISGKSDWDIDVVINQNKKDAPLVNIKAHSNLIGTRIHLPMPFTVDTDDAKKLSIEVDIYEAGHLNVLLDLDHSVHSYLRFSEQDDEQYRLESGHIQFGGDNASDVLGKGLSLKGSIDELNLDHWMAYLDGNDKGSNNKPLVHIASVDLNINHLVAYSVEANNTHLKAVAVERGLKGNIDSSVASGQFFIPVQQADNISINLEMDFVDIVLKESASNNKTQYSTKLIPNILFHSKKLGINGKQFTNATIIIESHEDHHFNLKALSLTHEKISLNASGNWLYDAENEQHFSKLIFNFDGEEFGQSLSQLGFGVGIENGAVNIKGKLFWERPFWDMDIEHVEGDVSFLLTDGYLINVEPGGGRFVGLLSLSALPRRLTLDFSDFFKEGLEFDKVKGNFRIYDGSMWTKNLKMKGAVADITIQGRTGLKSRDYDQLITVIPQIRDALPVLGSLISGSTVGWALLLIQRVFKDPIDESVSIKYKVTGDWDDPKIIVIEKPKVKEIEVDSNNEN